MNQIVFLRQGDTFVPASGTPTGYNPLPPGTYSVQEVGGTFILSIADDLGAPGKLYGEVEQRTQRALQTFNMHEDAPLGIMLQGNHGAGKSLLAYRICEVARTQYKMPTLLLNDPLGGTGFARFLSQIQQPMVLLADEFETVFDSKEKQAAMVPIAQGMYSTHKLFIMAYRDPRNIIPAFDDRPGRIHYKWEFERVSDAVVEEYIQDHLKNKEHAAGVKRVMQLAFNSSFDALRGLVREMNDYNESAGQAVRNLNISLRRIIHCIAEISGKGQYEGLKWTGIKAQFQIQPTMLKLRLNRHGGGGANLGGRPMPKLPSFLAAMAGNDDDESPDNNAPLDESEIELCMGQESLKSEDHEAAVYELENDEFVVTLRAPDLARGKALDFNF